MDNARIIAPPVLLRPPVSDDVPALVSGSRDPDTQRWIPAIPADIDADAAAEYLARRRELREQDRALTWAICEASSTGEELMGVITLAVRGRATDDPPGTGEIGYWVHPHGRGRGLARGAVRAVARHALLDVEDGGLGLARAAMRVAEPNEASVRVALGAGFTPTGRDRHAELLRDGTRVDLLRFDLLPDELGTEHG